MHLHQAFVLVGLSPFRAKISSIRTSSNSRRVQPIGALNPYANSWTIKARVTSKDDVRTFNQASRSGEPGQLLNIELMDEEVTLSLTLSA